MNTAQNRSRQGRALATKRASQLRLLKGLGLALGLGAVGALVVVHFEKKRLERDFGRGAEALRRQLERRGSGLRREIGDLAAQAAREALAEEIRDMGVTPRLMDRAQQAVEAADRLEGFASQTGRNLRQMLSELSERAQRILRGEVPSFR